MLQFSSVRTVLLVFEGKNMVMKSHKFEYVGNVQSVCGSMYYTKSQSNFTWASRLSSFGISAEQKWKLQYFLLSFVFPIPVRSCFSSQN